MTIRAELDNMRERAEGATERAGNGFPMALEECARTDLPRLLDALDAVYAELIEMDKSRDGILGRREIGTDEAATARTLGVVEARLSMAITTALEGK